MSTSQLKDTTRVESESMMSMKLLVGAINADESRSMFPSFNVMGNKSVKVKDLDKLTPQQFQELVEFIFGGYTTSKLSAALKNESAAKKLDSLTKLLPTANVVFDPKPGALYRALKDVFPEGSDLLLPSVVMNPSAEPQRTKKVLTYLCRLLLFVDNYSSEFASVQEEVRMRIDEKRQVKERLDATKTEINKRLLDLDMWKSEVPMWEKQSLEKKQEIEATSVKAVSMEEKVKEAEREYIKLEEKNKNTTRAISTTKKEIEELQTKVVSNGDGISHEHNQEAATLQDLARKRELINQQINETTRESEKVTEVTNACTSCISELKDMVQLMEELYDLQMNVHQAKAEKEEKEQSLKELEKHLKELQEQFSGAAPEEAKQQYEAELKKLEVVENELKALHLRSDKLREELSAVGIKIRDGKKLQPTKQIKIKELQEMIHQNNKFIDEEVPVMFANLENMVEDTLEDLRDSFADIQPSQK